METITISTSNSKTKKEWWEQALNFLWLEITPKCNLNCIHCYADSTPYNALECKIKYNDWVNILFEAYTLGCRQIQFIGGEPTIHPDLIKLIAKAREIGYDFIEVYTNGISISDKMFEAFIKHKVNLAFSIYSSTYQVHDEITNRKGSFEKTIKNLQNAKQLGLTSRVGIINMQQNGELINETIDFIKSLGIENIKVDVVRGIGRGDNLKSSTNPMSQLCGACWKGQLVVDAEGNVFPCVFSRFNVIGNITEGLSSILKKDSLNSFRKIVKGFTLNKDYSDGDCDPDINSACCSPDGTCSPEDDDSTCFTTKSTMQSLNVPDNSYELNLFRKYRDEWLKNQIEGEYLIKEYYLVSPEIVKQINLRRNSVEIYKAIWDNFLKPGMELIIQKRNLEALHKYKEMLDTLKERYYCR